jgi:hypothetical protein
MNLYIAAQAMLVEKPSSEAPKIGSQDEVFPYDESQRIIGDIWNLVPKARICAKRRVGE